MRLTKTERLILANQYRILELLEPDNAESYEKIREGIEWGYEAAIDDVLSNIFDGLEKKECSFVVHVMSMYDALQRSYRELEDKTGIEEREVEFPGFDGNNETSYYAYAKYVVEREERFTYLKGADDLNSHMPMLQSYRQMLPVWEDEMDSPYEMSHDQMRRVLDGKRRRDA